MKSCIIIFISALFFNAACAQTEITPELIQKLKKDIELQVPALKKKLEKQKTGDVEIEFIVDTFRIEKLMEKCVALNYADFSMRDAGYKAAEGYDSLLNKYYKKLMAVLKGDDKKVLQQAQKNWLAFRDSETNLVETISKDEYSGGGTMQQLSEASMYLDLIKSRVFALFSHYTRAAQIY
ncbi:lysozyme inhibitor LprI family protein [Ferruginibacter sp.]